MLTDKQLYRMSFRMFVIYIRIQLDDGRNVFVPRTDIHGNAVAYYSPKNAAPELYRQRELYGKRNATLLKVGRIS